jgi:transcriptional regulator with XRE-family HTH domain
MTTFSDWLTSQLHERNLSPADLSRLIKKDQSVISRILSGERKPANATLEAIAKALKLPPAQVFEAAGILPPKGDTDPWVEKMSHILEMLNPENREMAERLIETMVEQEQAKNNDKNTQKISGAKRTTNGKSA